MPHESRALALPRVVWGRGVAQRALTDALAGVDPTAVLVICSPSVARTPAFARLLAAAPGAAVFDGVRRHAPVECVEEAWRAGAAQGAPDAAAGKRSGRASPDASSGGAPSDGPCAVVGVGGGAVCDATKLVALAFASGRSPRELLSTESPSLDRQVRAVAIPTTPTAATFTADASSLVAGAKRVLRGRDLVVDAAILDADACPPPRATFARSAFPAITHCVDPLLIAPSNPFASVLAERALQRLLPALSALARAEDRAARQAALEGAWLAAAAVSSAGVGLPHALCQVVGTASGAAHGEVHAILLPLLLGSAPRDFAAVAAAVVAAREALDQPATLRELGVERTSLGDLAQRTLDHPMVGRARTRTPAVGELEGLLERAWGR
jgi:alcohol dehydrogenase class IV